MDNANPTDRFTVNGYLDLETCATTPNASVWQLGFVFTVTDHIGHQTFVSDLAESIQVTLNTDNPENIWDGATHGHTSDDTLWWLDVHKLSPKAATCGVEIIDNPTLGLATFNAASIEGILFAIRNGFEIEVTEYREDEGKLSRYDIANLMRNRNLTTIYTWGNFDQAIYEHAIEQHGLVSIFHYGSFCSLRDVCKFHNLEQSFRPDTSTHEAIRDAYALRNFHGELVERLASHK